MDFEVPMAAEAAVKALQAQGIQAQMAKVRIIWHNFHIYSFVFSTIKQYMDQFLGETCNLWLLPVLDQIISLIKLFINTRWDNLLVVRMLISLQRPDN